MFTKHVLLVAQKRHQLFKKPTTSEALSRQVHSNSEQPPPRHSNVLWLDEKNSKEKKIFIDIACIYIYIYMYTYIPTIL